MADNASKCVDAPKPETAVGNRPVESRLRKTLLRAVALIAAMEWCVALCLPFSDVIIVWHRSFQNSIFGSSSLGWELAVWGALGPLALSPVWYANLPLFFCLFRMFRGEMPGRRLPAVALVIALLVFVPHGHLDWEFGGMLWAAFRGPAVWLWVSSFVSVWLGLLLVRQMPGQPQARVETQCTGISPGGVENG